jgi:hypothetical protein
VAVTPTETGEHRRAEYDVDHQPDHRWTTWPDTDAPGHRTLLGVMTHPRRPVTRLDGLAEDLRELFGSVAADLPLLHPCASSAAFRIRTPGGTRLVNGEFTEGPGDGAHRQRADRVVAGRRRGHRCGDRRPGDGCAGGSRGRQPREVRLEGWSATPAEVLHIE